MLEHNFSSFKDPTMRVGVCFFFLSFLLTPLDFEIMPCHLHESGLNGFSNKPYLNSKWLSSSKIKTFVYLWSETSIYDLNSNPIDGKTHFLIWLKLWQVKQERRKEKKGKERSRKIGREMKFLFWLLLLFMHINNWVTLVSFWEANLIVECDMTL